MEEMTIHLPSVEPLSRCSLPNAGQNADHERLRFDIVAHTVMVHSDRHCLCRCTIAVTSRGQVIEATLQGRLEVGPVRFRQCPNIAGVAA